jgi:hypothetical protein
MAAIKRWRLSLYFIGQIGALVAIPGATRWLLGSKGCLATAVLTNVGDPTRRFRVRFPRRDNKAVVGNLLLENIVGAPPLRALTRVGVAVGTYGGQMGVSVLCDRHRFSRQQARRFLEIYLHRIAQGLPASNRADESGEACSGPAITSADG